MTWRTSPPDLKWKIGAPTTTGGTLPATISATSTERVRVPIAAREDGAGLDPTNDTVEMAFMATTDVPDGPDWTTAAWEADAGRYLALCLVGPTGNATLGIGRYAVWIRITRGDEAVVRRAGPLVVGP